MMIEGSGSGRPKNMWIRWIRIWIRNTAGQNRFTWKTPSRVAFVPLQEPLAVLPCSSNPDNLAAASEMVRKVGRGGGRGGFWISDPGSRIPDPGSRISDLGSRIWDLGFLIRDLQIRKLFHWHYVFTQT